MRRSKPRRVSGRTRKAEERYWHRQKKGKGMGKKGGEHLQRVLTISIGFRVKIPRRRMPKILAGVVVRIISGSTKRGEGYYNSFESKMCHPMTNSSEIKD